MCIGLEVRYVSSLKSLEKLLIYIVIRLVLVRTHTPTAAVVQCFHPQAAGHTAAFICILYIYYLSTHPMNQRMTDFFSFLGCCISEQNNNEEKKIKRRNPIRKKQVIKMGIINVGLLCAIESVVIDVLTPDRDSGSLPPPTDQCTQGSILLARPR